MPQKKFASAYTVTNENMRKIASVFGPRGGDVLTVAASGDQALFFMLSGAKSVDTYDIVPYARVVQDIKTEIIPVVSRPDYFNLLDELHDLCVYDIEKQPVMREIFSWLSPDTRAVLDNVNGRAYPFDNGLRYEHYFEFQPNEREYAQLQNLIRQPFNFVETDVMNLKSCFNKKYDVIYVSNIFDGWSTDAVAQCVSELKPLLRDGGQIVYAPQMSSVNFDTVCKSVGNMTLQNNTCHCVAMRKRQR